MREKSRTLFIGSFLLLWSMCSAAQVTDPKIPAEEDDPTAGTLEFLQRQISVGEADEAISQLNGLVSQIELAQHRYHKDLLFPVMLLGDAHVEQGEFAEAIKHYGRARHIARVSRGLFHPSQIQVLYREANVLAAIGDTKTSGEREEYAYEVARRAYDEDDLELIPPIQRLSAFYLRTGNPLAARTLLHLAQLINQKNNSDRRQCPEWATAQETDTAVAIFRAIAKSHRLERFPQMYVDPGPNEDHKGRYVASLDPNRPAPILQNQYLDGQFRSINSFPEGERALKKVVSIMIEKFGDDSPETIRAMIDLADWYLMFNLQHEAKIMYRLIYFKKQGKLDPPGGKGDAFFDKAVLLYFPQPENPMKASSTSDYTAQGKVAITFNVSPRGKVQVRSMQTTDVVGPKNMNIRVRRSMRLAIFRPRLVAGKVVTSENHTYAHQFPYVPKPIEREQDLSEQEPPEQEPAKESKSESSGATGGS